MTKKLTLFLSILLVIVFFHTAVSAEEVKPEQIVIVCHKDFPLTRINNKLVEEIFLGRTTSVGEKKVKVNLATLKEGPVHESFVKNYIRKTTTQFKNFWKKLVFSGKAKMPKSFKTEKELVQHVQKTKGAIGYIHIKTSKDNAVVTDAVKVLAVKKK
ncbi:MAG: hypothetical protein MJB14_16630 [Spirochaetes bacterium]|nr:hypothetical protein [Spirochaetota bacterium]